MGICICGPTVTVLNPIQGPIAGQSILLRGKLRDSGITAVANPYISKSWLLRLACSVSRLARVARPIQVRLQFLALM
jgi:hypothetical protein